VPSLLLSAQNSSSKEDSHADLLSWRNLLYNETTKLPSQIQCWAEGCYEQVFRGVRKEACSLSKPKDKHGGCSANPTSHLHDFWLSSWGDMGIGRLLFQLSRFLPSKRAFSFWWWKNIIGPNTCLCCHAFEEMCYLCGQKHRPWRWHGIRAGGLQSLQTTQRGDLNGSVRVLLLEEHGPWTSAGPFSRAPKHYTCCQRHAKERQRKNLKLHTADLKPVQSRKQNF